MTDEPSPPEQAAPSLNDHLRHMIGKLREDRRLSFAELSRRLADVGQPIPVLGLRRIEKGERRVDIDEIAAFGMVFGVPPIYLFLPVGAQPQTAVLPGRAVETGQALEWFTGEAPLATEPAFDDEDGVVAYTFGSADFNAWHVGGEPLRLYREHQKLLESWRMERMHARSDRVAALKADDEEQRRRLRAIADESERAAREVEKALIEHREATRRRGEWLPYVNELEGMDLDYVDGRFRVVRRAE